jgi:hypothetical protein
MKSLPNSTFNFSRTATAHFSMRTLVLTISIIIGISIAVYALMIDPNDVTATIGVPP